MPSKIIRNLVIVLGDQLNLDATALQDFDPVHDGIWMAEAALESTHVPSSKIRIVLFLSAMRHFAQELRAKGWPVDYTELNTAGHSGSLMGELEKAVHQYTPTQLIVTQPVDHRTLEGLKTLAVNLKVPLSVRPDHHFFTQPLDFEKFAANRKQLRMEFWYRELRKKFNILMQDGQPIGGEWNYDAQNRQSFGKAGPVDLPQAYFVPPDAITREVIELVNRHFDGHMGDPSNFSWPVTRQDALRSLQSFIEKRLPLFGYFEDAMWTNEPWLYHAHLSAALNLKLLNPHEVVSAAQQAYKSGNAPIASVEGFIRQILGWREYVRGMYWLKMPNYLSMNALEAKRALPSFYWNAQTDMACLKAVITQTMAHGYAHHIQRLMVLGLYTLMLGVDPRFVHEWFLSVFVDAVEWVELPNTLGMSQYGDGGLMASKPYIASGKYIQRMSNYCKSCPYDPAVATGPKACPMTTLYWNFLMQHQSLLSKNPRMAMQLKNLARLSDDQRVNIQIAAQEHMAMVKS